MIKTMLFILFLLTPIVLFSQTFDYQAYKSLSLKAKKKLVNKKASKAGKYYTAKIGIYRIFSDIDKETTVEAGYIMDEYYSHVSKLFKDKSKKPKIVTLYLLNSDNSYTTAIQEFHKDKREPSSKTGVFCRKNSKSAVFINYGKRKKSNILKTMYHECTHQILRGHIKGFIPKWFNEGTAMNLESWKISKANENNVHNSLYASTRPYALSIIYPNKGYVPLEKLLTMDRKEFYATATKSANYTSSWVVIHYLLSTKSGRTLFNKLIAGFKAGKKQRRLLSKTLVKKIQKQLNNHIKNVIIPNANYSYYIEMFRKAKTYGRALKTATTMKKKYPNSPIAKFYIAWLSILNGDKSAKHLEVLEDFKKNKNKHPNLYQALTQCYSIVKPTDWEIKVKNYSAKALKADWDDQITLAILNPKLK